MSTAFHSLDLILIREMNRSCEPNGLHVLVEVVARRLARKAGQLSAQGSDVAGGMNSVAGSAVSSLGSQGCGW